MKYKNEWTCIGCGIRTAQDVLTNSKRPNTHKVVIVVTDGENNKPDNKDEDLLKASTNIKSSFLFNYFSRNWSNSFCNWYW